MPAYYADCIEVWYVFLVADLPGFTRSTYSRDHALITPESRVWAGQPGW